ncbi:ethanolamine ammonia-lyase reactivating factor EutA [Cytobacillus sp. FSL W8-0315]|uniref:ethanolamine ammonia-lyase reactivating factor EutA n=1 Tax=Cytobacillus TaxID=2675230 RepID=UPI0001F44D84|nr:ethanolamine ammonia-lyase reactivating factor EutA [Cytobacillus oceanisediminis]EFV76170.1 ethanolamine utilization protein EutA [Bacillus sp. 2_A_57_CT2]MCM3244214.1 ethanolamine ammonia-lyase reactivating factor EutA [Cytobacillus oceanisediminis]MCS0825967.1 ethanolamine ammonia-lyase reactivating factor EutA [Cytobacillus firmus]QOK28713.1 ethanolamine ammonia-lyase reactivating factor EutA [Cytobacillus oceanisediminis]
MLKRYDAQKENIISAGIDIGTSTTKLVISRFSLMNMAGGTHMPRIEIIEKEVLYRSPIYRTPLLTASSIDIEAVERLVRDEYTTAGIRPADIKTGAVIITGETATKQNAEEMVHYLSDHAGDFLVATAGPDLEGIIAAKGSGAYELSKRTGKTVANIDIGGGTANAAVYRSGRLCGTCTLHIGGRLIEFTDGKINSISPPVQQILRQWGADLKRGDSRSHPIIGKLTDYMAEAIARMLRKDLLKDDLPLLLGHDPNWTEEIDYIMFSGGIGECLYHFENADSSPAQYDDIGKQLAQSLQNCRELASFKWVEPDETVRATVLGAGTQTTEISGATIHAEGNELPIRNLPVYQIRFDYNLEKGLHKIQEAVKKAVEIYDPQKEGQNFALYLTALPYLGFRDIQELSSVLLKSLEAKPIPEQPLVVVLESDHAKVLGQTIKVQETRQSIVCIDQIKVEHGDYIDIGHLLQTNVVPVVIKTLTFHR